MGQLHGMEGWVEVTEDLYDIAARVRDYDAKAILARYRAGDGQFPQGQLAVLRWIDVENEDGTPLRTWYPAIVCKDTDGVPMTGVPDPRILQMMRLFDAWKAGHETPEKMSRRTRHIREGRAKEKSREAIGPTSEKFVYGFRRHMGVKTHAYVPSGSGTKWIGSSGG